MSLSPQTVFRGTDAEIYMEGNWVTNITQVQAQVDIDQTELKLLGQWWTQNRNMGMSGTGTLTGVFVNTSLLEKIGSIQKGKEYRTEIVIVNTNPDVNKTYRVRLQNVIFTSIPLGNFQSGELATQEFPFKFAGYEILNTVH